MKHKTMRGAACLLALALALGGCAQSGPSDGTGTLGASDTGAGIETAGTTTEEELLADLDKDFWLLTPEQRLEDFDYLYSTLDENYPYFGVVERKAGVNLPQAYEETRKLVAACENDYEYFLLVRQFIQDLDYTGHVSLWHPYWYAHQLEEYRQLMNDEEYRDYATTYYNSLYSETAVGGNAALESFLDARDARLALLQDEEEINEDTGKQTRPNVETEILEEGRIAYVNIRSFPMSYDEDAAVLLPFYRQVADYDHLIIDITENGGGSMRYYNELILRPLMQEPLGVAIYALVKDGALNRADFLDYGIENGEYRPISEFPDLAGANKDDLEENTHFMQGEYYFEPAVDGVAFQGRVWLLVGEGNYSSSEYAAMFSKHSGFATLVGDNTGGDGIGTDPTVFTLPYSGLAVQYASIHGLTADGRGSEEFGTEPDIFKQADETALQACLRAIG